MLSLYRRHRPRTFDAVVGQEHIVRTLRNAVELDKVHHAYLFVGSRGTGKTSLAKLLACALNAEGGPRTDFSPDDPACRAIADGTSLDVVEMDAASNNSVDDIRELRENVSLAPMGGGRRVYILDEAHMLTTPAWNAFLKTLEEPPAHVVFVLATTEAHKVPATIVDRCHRFDFQRPSLEQVAGVLRRVADEEGIEVPDAAVGMIARSATGSFRDALGTLEQLVTYGGAEIKLDDVLEVLGVADAEHVLAAADSLADHDPKAALMAVERVSASGRDLTQFMRDLAAHLRHVYVVQTLGDVPDSFSVTAEHTDRLAGQADRLAKGEVLRAVELLGEALTAVRDGSEPRIRLELALLKAVQPQADMSLQALMFRIEQLEQRLATVDAGGAAGTGSSGTSGGDGAPEQAAATSHSGGPAAQAAGTGRPAGAQAGTRDAASASAAAAPAATASAAAAPASGPRSDGGTAVPAPGVASEPVSAAARDQGSGPMTAAARKEAPETAGGAVSTPPAELDHGRLAALWPAVVEAVREENGMLAAFLADARPAEVDSGRLLVEFPFDADFAKRKAQSNSRLIESAVRGITGHALRLECRTSDGHTASEPARLTPEELVARVLRECDAREVFEEPGADEAPGDTPPPGPPAVGERSPTDQD